MRLFIADPDSERPMSATVGPMMTGGMSLLIQPAPANLIASAMITYTSAATIEPTITPRYPYVTPVTSGVMNAKELPRNTGLLKRVNRRYTIVPTPAPMSAADWLR